MSNEVKKLSGKEAKKILAGATGKEVAPSPKPKKEIPWITTVTRADGSGDTTIRFVDNTEIVKLGVSDEDYKAFEATFSKKDWQESSLAFLSGELAKYKDKE